MKRQTLCALALAVLFIPNLPAAHAASWKGIEPLKSKRADVERALGAPVRETPSDGGLHFNVAGGKVTVFFVTPKFIAAKKLSPALEGTVLQIVLQHERAIDTPEMLGLDKDKKFERTSDGKIAVYTNNKDGLSYTFVEGRLTTTRYSAPAEELAKHFKKG
jgi:hypothetical protein